MGRLFGTDGIRGIANIDLKPTLAFALGRATASAAITEIELFVHCIQQGLEAVVHAGHKPARKQARKPAGSRR
jgi:phosphomannomutase